MKPKKQEKQPQIEMYKTRLEVLCDRGHPLIVLAKDIDWTVFEDSFEKLYSENGRPGVPTRVLVALHYLKHMFNESDESVVERFIENPYWQSFCGFEYFQYKFPIDPSSMTRWRSRIGSKQMKLLLTETLETAKRQKQIGRNEFSRVNVDTTVQEKVVAHPTDDQLYQKARIRLVKAAKQYRRAAKMTKKLHGYLGRVMRDIRRNCLSMNSDLSMLLEITGWIYEQKKKDKNKVYAVHEECNVFCVFEFPTILSSHG